MEWKQSVGIVGGGGGGGSRGEESRSGSMKSSLSLALYEALVVVVGDENKFIRVRRFSPNKFVLISHIS